jgi:RNA polymerase sigma factor (sigma-70 family)
VTENQVMLDVRDGKIEALAILFERHHLALFNFFLRLTQNRPAAEDLVQEVFIRILKYRTTYMGEDRFAVWMHKIARNAHNDFLRKRRDTMPLETRNREPSNPEPSPEDRLARQSESAILSKALSRLHPKKKEILMLSRFQNLKYREIADLMDCPIGTVKGMVHRAIRELGDIYADLTKEACRHEL